MLLKVEERRLDAAVMRFVGVRRRTIFGALLLEAILVAAVGSACSELDWPTWPVRPPTPTIAGSSIRPDLLRYHSRHRLVQRRAVAGAGCPGGCPGGLATGPNSPAGAVGAGMSRAGLESQEPGSTSTADRPLDRGHRGLGRHAAGYGDAERWNREVVCRAASGPRIPDPARPPRERCRLIPMPRCPAPPSWSTSIRQMPGIAAAGAVLGTSSLRPAERQPDHSVWLRDPARGAGPLHDSLRDET